jgi:uncharacterized protein
LQCIFVSDLHGNNKRYSKLFKIIEKEKPAGIFFGGDILPNGFGIDVKVDNFIQDVFFKNISRLKRKGIESRFFTIFGNDDPRIYEKILIDAEKDDLIEYVHNRSVSFDGLFVTGYSYVPPTPFKLKDWERYDISQFVDVGAISPEEGIRTVKVPKDKIRYSTIKEDLDTISNKVPVEKTIFLFHSPPYKSYLDRAELDGIMVEYAPVDVNVGSIAIKNFIEKKQPFLTLHGHVHESARLTGYWKEKFGKTYSFSAAHDGPELSLIRFCTNNLKNARRDLI